LISGAIAGALLGSDIVRLVSAGRLPSGELRSAAFAAAALLGAVGLSGRHTRQTLELARRLERARNARATGVLDGRVVTFPTAVRPG
jgi:uncharacterized membrane protein